ncbi:MAG: ArsR/SmtB family transcription factor, partial [Acidimicrobiia bacterium]
MPDHSAPDYEIDDTFTVKSDEQFKALFEDTRKHIVDLLLDRAATIKELADALDKPKGTIGHHVAVLVDTGLIRIVRTKKVRAIEAKYYGRVARTYLLSPSPDEDISLSPDYFLTTGATEFAAAAMKHRGDNKAAILSTLRYVRIPNERAKEWGMRLGELVQEFTADP